MERSIGHKQELKLKLGFNSKGEPVLALYDRATDIFILELSFDAKECIYFRDFFIQFGRLP